MKNAITKRICGKVFYLTSFSWITYLPQKPGVVVIECKKTGRLAIRSGADLRALAIKTMTKESGNIFYKKRSEIKRDAYLFWHHQVANHKDTTVLTNDLKNGLNDKLIKTSDEIVGGYRGFMLVHKPSGYYHLLLKENRAFDFGAWLRKLSYKITHENEHLQNVDVIALTSHSGRHGIVKEDFVVHPLFAGVEDLDVADSLLVTQSIINGTDKLLTRGIVPDQDWGLGKRFVLLRK